MPQNLPRQMPPAEVLTQLTLGINLYTDPTMTVPKMWVLASNVYSGLFGFVQRARFANIVTSAFPSPFNAGLPFASAYFFALPGLSNYLLADYGDGSQWAFDSGSNYARVQRISPYAPTLAQTMGPWSRQTLQNIVYEMNGQIKQSGRLANAATIEGWGLDTPDTSVQVVISAGNTITLSSISRASAIVTAVLSSPPTADMVVGSMVNVVSVSDPSFNGTFVILTLVGSTLTWSQIGNNTAAILGSGSVTTQISKGVGRSYAWAWENANKFHVSAPSPSSQFIQYNLQEGAVQLIELGTVSMTAFSNVVTGVGTAFTSAWIGRTLWINGSGQMTQITGVSSPTSMTLRNAALVNIPSNVFMVYDPQSTHVRLYATGDGGAVYFRVQRNAFVPAATTLVAAGLQFSDTANSEPPNFPFTTETSQLYNIPPPVGKFTQEYQGAILIYGIPGALQSFFYTNQTLTQVGQPQESSAPLNQVTLPIQNAAINGMVEFPGSLIIWSDKQDMFRLTGTLTDNTAAIATAQGAAIAALPYNLGCASPFAVALTPLGAIWLTPNAEVWLFTDRYAPRNIGHPIEALLKSVTPSMLASARMTYYHAYNRNWVALSVATNGATINNTVFLLDLDQLASNGSPSFFVFDMATNQPVWYQFNTSGTSLVTMYEAAGRVRLLATGVDNIRDIDYQGGSGAFGTEIAVPNAFVNLHAWGNDRPFEIKRPSWFRFNTNRDPSVLAADGWSFQALGIDDDFYTFAEPLTLTMIPGVNDSSSLSGNSMQAIAFGSPFRHSPEMFKVGGVNFVMGRRLQFVVNFPSAPGADYQLRGIQIGFGPSPPR